MLPKSPKLLIFYLQLKVYHYLYNVIELVQINSFWYWFCNKTLGCRKKKEMVKKSCLLCILKMDKKSDTYEWEKVKKRPLEFFIFRRMFVWWRKKKNWFQKLIVELWSGEVSYRGGVGGGGLMGKGLNGK